MAQSELAVFIAGEPAGTLIRSSTGLLSFAYHKDYQGVALSRSMPCRPEPYPQKTVLPYLFGLLPDAEESRASVAREAGCSPNNAFGLLSYIGLDCPGAVQFCTPDKAAELGKRESAYVPLSDKEIGQRLEQLGTDAEASWMAERERWSLAGNQDKFALAWHEGQWCSCTGAAPTTHIFKNGIRGFRLEALDEFFCMKLATACGLLAADVSYKLFDGKPCMIVKRFDRMEREDGTVGRIHQEDLCQALSYMPSQKYASDGGPAVPEIAALLLGTFAPRENMEHFVEDLFFCCLTGAIDAHAKNYALLLGSKDVAFLSPLYDVASVLGYSEMRRKARLAMSIGGENRLGRMSRQALERFAKAGRLDEFGLDVSWCISLMQDIGEEIRAKEAGLFDEMADIPGMEELRAHLEAPLVENVSSILACISS